MNILAAVIVQVIGLAVLRNESELGGMHAVLPAVTGAAGGVESHEAILVFKKSDHVNNTNWTLYELDQSPEYRYVKLKGERVRFIVNGANVRAKIPKELPHLQNICARMQELREGYEPPAYAAAASVVMLPHGEASACKTNSLNGRIDTRVMLLNTGQFQVTSCDKLLTLRDGAVVSIVNAPVSWIDQHKVSSGKHIPHSNVYISMSPEPSPRAERESCQLVRPARVARCPELNNFKPEMLATGHDVLHHLIAPRGGGDHTPVQPAAGLTFECSNTQWP